jgi:hypothetical protein
MRAWRPVLFAVARPCRRGGPIKQDDECQCATGLCRRARKPAADGEESPRYPGKPGVRAHQFPPPRPGPPVHITHPLRLASPPQHSTTKQATSLATNRKQQAKVFSRGRRRRPTPGGDGSSSDEGVVVDGGHERGRRGGAQGPGRPLPLELRAAVRPPHRQGQRAQRLRRAAGQGPGPGGGEGAAGGQGRRGGGLEDRHVPQLLGTQLTSLSYLSLPLAFFSDRELASWACRRCSPAACP